MRHPHADLIKEWVEDPSRVVQVNIDGDWEDIALPSWVPIFEYRFKPEPKPNVVQEWWISRNSALVSPNLYKEPNVKLTFDGETGKLIKAEVIE